MLETKIDGVWGKLYGLIIVCTVGHKSATLQRQMCIRAHARAA